MLLRKEDFGSSFSSRYCYGFFLVFIGTFARAHGLETTAWQWSLTGVACLGAGALYIVLSQTLKRQIATNVLRHGQVLAFAFALVVLALALLSPLATWAHHSFAAHMTQHMLLILVVSVLLAYAAPGWMLLWLLPLSCRQRGRSVWRWLGSVLRFISKPLFSWLIFAAVIWLWHLPRLYTWALAYPLVHALEHFTMLFSATLFWWLIIQPFGRKRPKTGTGTLYLVTTLIHTGLLGALLTFATVPFYATDNNVTITGASALEDQQLAGLIMWVPMGLVLGTWAVTLLGQWLRQMEKRLPG